MDDKARFSDAVAAKLGYYVHRLIDPRNGETFYVGKGKGNRVFAHMKGELGADADSLTEKLQRIRDVRRNGFEVAHVIHRHGMDEDTAFEVEAALIDAYPEASNSISGRASDERGLMHARQIIERFEAKEAVFEHRAILITVNQSAAEKDTYEAVRCLETGPKKGRAVRVCSRCRSRTDCWSLRRGKMDGCDCGEFSWDRCGQAWPLGI